MNKLKIKPFHFCRSPSAEAIIRSLVQKRRDRSEWEIDNGSDSRGLEVSRDHGARQVHEDDFRNFDVILSFDDSNVADLKFPGRMMVALEQK